MRNLRWLVAGVLVAWVVGTALLVAPTAQAVPAWGRAYDVDCSACHTGGFKLNRTGQNFLRAGHRMEDGEQLGLGDHLSVAQKVRFNWAQTDTNGTVLPGSKTNSFEQHALSLYIGGPLDKNWSYFAELYWHENSGKTSGASDFDDFGRSKLADAYLQYVRHYSEDSYSSIRFGQFTPYLLHMHGIGSRMTQDRAVVLSSFVGDNPYRPFTRQYGLEGSYYARGVNAALAVVNGTGAKTTNRVDNDLKKDVYGTLDYTLDDQGSILGVYGYLGHYPLALDNPTKYRAKTYDDFNQVGVMGNFTRKQGALVGAVYLGRNEFSTEAVAPVDSTTERKSLGAFGEVHLYGLHPNVQPFARFDFFDSDTDLDDNEVMGVQVGLSWQAIRTGRLVGHYQYLQTSKPKVSGVLPPKETKGAVTIEANWMF